MMKRMGGLTGLAAGKAKGKTNRRQAMRELNDLLGGQGGLPGGPGTPPFPR
jgi:hypothetical protein